MLQPYHTVTGLYKFPLNFNGVIKQGAHPDKQKAKQEVPYPEPGHVRIRTSPRWALDDSGQPPIFSEEKDALLARILIYTYLIGVGTRFHWTLNYGGPSLVEPLPTGYWLAATAARIQEDSRGQISPEQIEATLHELTREDLLTQFDLPEPAYGPTTTLILRLVFSRDIYAGQSFYNQKVRNPSTF